MPGSADGATQAHTWRQRREQRRKAALAPTQASSPAQTLPPHQHRHPLQLLVLLLQLGLHLVQPILDAAVTLSHLLAKNSVSSARNDPVLTARGLGLYGRQVGRALCGPLAPGSWGACPHACSRSLCGFVCDAWITEGAGDRLVRGDVLPLPRPCNRGLCAPSSDCLWQASTGSRQRQVRDARGTHSTFLSWEGSSNRLASLEAELPKTKGRTTRPTWDGQQRCQGRGETKPEEEDHGRRAPPGGC